MTWYYFVKRTSPAGQEWYTQYTSSGCEALAQDLDICVDLLRRNQLEAGAAKLAESLETLRSFERAGLPVPVLGVVQEAYFGANAYLHYRRGSYAAAHESLDAAAHYIAQVVEQAPFLVTFTVKCYDFCLHRARIERCEHRWSQMHSYLQHGREMLLGTRPLCTLSNKSVFIGEVERFYQAANAINPLESEALSKLRDRDAARLMFEQRALGAAMKPGVVVDY
ncbi:hypothetical protein [Haliangium ochraceum]|uniref:hypothetical protein n=1 Tax=Haliangium ochraceum TaxID=80816 RepID=UPI001269CAFC|nr:hypothetical protein [Haliangium ochraceum]